MVTFDTVPPFMIDPIVDEILKTSQNEFQELDSQIFMRLILAGREVSVKFLHQKTIGFGASEGAGYGDGEGRGWGVSNGCGLNQISHFQSFRGDGFRKFLRESQGMGNTFGKGIGEGSGKFPFLETLDPFWRGKTCPSSIYHPEYDWFYALYDYYEK